MQLASRDSRLRPIFDHLDCLFFDCDGVVFDSNAFKVRAMQHALRSHSDRQRNAMLNYWRSNGGRSRWAKFEHFFNHIAPCEDAAARVDQAVREFGAYSRAAYRDVAPVPQALELARRLGPERCYIASGAAQQELREVFAAKGILGYFAKVLGSPTPKLELVRQVLEQRRCAPERACLIGDGAVDFRVSQELGMHFIYLRQMSEWTSVEQTLRDAEPVTWADTWDELLSALAPDTQAPALGG